MHSVVVPFALFGFLVAVASAASNQKIGVAVYYESLCPDSIKFMTKQLYPTYNTELKDYMNITLVPFGKASYHQETETKKKVFKCRHGEVECEGDKVQACVIDIVKDEPTVMKFIDCAMSASSKSTPYPTDKCLKEASINATEAEEIKNCSMSDKGSDLLEHYFTMTGQLNPTLESVPRVDINGKFNATEQKPLTEDFKATFCSYIQGAKPEECSKKSGAATLVASLLPIVSVLILTRISN